MFPVVLKTESETLTKTYQTPVLLSEILSEAGLAAAMPCGGHGTCGKCKVTIKGACSPLTAEEKAALNETEIAAGVRLACQAYATGDCTLYFSTETGGIQGVADANFAPVIPDEGGDGYGAAVDIGTTTVAAYLYTLADGKCIRTVCEENLQTAFGADVIARIESANKGGLAKLSDTIRGQIKRIFEKEFCITPDKAVITGNTTMLHLLAGLDPRGLAVSPFTPASLFGAWHDNVYLPRCISAYVGADITCAVLASGMCRRGASLLVDIGTNGEMALWHDGRLVCCSTAAGPAFEGALISQGMSALPGAISRVWMEDGAVCYETIDRQPPRGICGSGLIDAVACMRSCGALDETGYLEQDYQIADSGVCITAQDIRQLQLAKSAIHAGIETLMHVCGLSASALETFYIAGGFGKYMNVENAAAIGLIPKALVEKAVVLGNAAGAGASMALLSRAALEESERIAQMAEVEELSSSAVFMERYMENMMF